MFKDPFVELQLKEQREKDRENWPKMGPPSPVDNSEENEAELKRREVAKVKATQEREKENFERKQRENRERGLAAQEYHGIHFSDAAMQERFDAEKERNSSPNRMGSCPICRTSVQLVDGRVPKHHKRVPDPDTGTRWEECDPQQTPEFISDYIPHK